MKIDWTKLMARLREIHSEPGVGGTMSWGRIASSVALAASIVWVSWLVFHTHALPALDGITGFVAAPYASNKVATAAQSFAQK
jgi:hypothetical protein